MNATIERSLLDGTNRTVVVHDNLFQPLSIAIDAEQNLLYWSDRREGIYYSIESSDLNGGSRKTLIHGTHHQPFAIALDERNIYWSDWVNNAVWSMPKNSFQGGVQPDLYAKYKPINTPMGLITPAGNMTAINETYCKMDRVKVSFNNFPWYKNGYIWYIVISNYRQPPVCVTVDISTNYNNLSCTNWIILKIRIKIN